MVEIRAIQMPNGDEKEIFIPLYFARQAGKWLPIDKSSPGCSSHVHAVEFCHEYVMEQYREIALLSRTVSFIVRHRNAPPDAGDTDLAMIAYHLEKLHRAVEFIELDVSGLLSIAGDKDPTDIDPDYFYADRG